MQEPRYIPKALAIVALLFLLGGISSAIEMLVKLAAGKMHLDFGVLGIPAFFGLRRFSPGWRTYTLFCCWIGFILCPVFFVLGFTIGVPAHFNFLGLEVGRISPIWISVASVVWFSLSLWQYRVLTRPDIRKLFYPASGSII